MYPQAQFCTIGRKGWLFPVEGRMVIWHQVSVGPVKAGVMTIRSRREAITFKHPFRIRGIDRLLPAGTYEVITDEESIEGLSFAAFRRIATKIMVRGATSASTREMISIGSVDLADAQRIDAGTPNE
jgi:hypothetical protein